MTIQIGQLSSPAQIGVASRLIENQLTAADRYNLAASRLKVLSVLGLPVPDSGNREANLVFDTLRASTGKSPDLLSLQVSGYSRDQAAAALNASFQVLKAEHIKLFEPTFNRMKSDLENATTRLAAAEREYARSYETLKSGASQPGAGGNAARDILVTNMATLINAQIVQLKQQVLETQEVLEPTRSYPTRAIGDVFVPEHPSTPSPTMLIVSGALLGLLGGAVFALLRKSIRN